MALNNEDDQDRINEARELIAFAEWRQRRDLMEEFEKQSSLQRAADSAGRVKVLSGFIFGTLVAIITAAWNVFLLNQRITDNARDASALRATMTEVQLSAKETEKKVNELDRDVDLLKRGVKP